ncbi:MAG: hypothetical protein HYY06_26150 [Deltaproteobacteria bacterium]|nr:hypothetical protein [Deltaproteobacteria bacterium]
MSQTCESMGGPLTMHPTPAAAPREKVPTGIRWGRALAVVLVVATGAGAYMFNEWRKTEALRAEILRAYERTAHAYRSPIDRLERKIVAKIRQAGGAWEGELHDPIFRVSALQKGTGFYVRLPRAAARSDEAIRRAARRQHSDSFAGCLAVSPALFGRLLVLGDLVGKDFENKLRDAGNVARLRALDQDFALRARRDLPRLAEMLRPDYLIAVLDVDAARGVHEAHVWDLHSGRELVRARLDRAVGRSDVLNVRWSGHGTVPSKRPADRSVVNTANDCAIAARVREVSGETLTTIGAPSP